MISSRPTPIKTVRQTTGIIFLLAVMLLPVAAFGGGAPAPVIISITGAVRHPLELTRTMLTAMESQVLQGNDINRDGSYRGVFSYRGVPLKNLLELAGITKKDPGFKKPIDTAVLVKNRNGQQVALSWGEIFYRQPGNVILAHTGTPLRPAHGDCRRCHEDTSIYETRLAPLGRTVPYPKLITAGDRRADRWIEDIVEIEVVELPAKPGDQNLKPLYAAAMGIVGQVAKPMTLTALPAGLKRHEINIYQVGDGRLYHGPGEITFSGISFQQLLQSAGICDDLTAVIVVWSPDGYRSLFSVGEVLLGKDADRMLLADHRNGEKLDEDGRFELVVPTDLMADRWIKAVGQVDVRSLVQ
jgi:hypothetical protein